MKTPTVTIIDDTDDLPDRKKKIIDAAGNVQRAVYAECGRLGMDAMEFCEILAVALANAPGCFSGPARLMTMEFVLALTEATNAEMRARLMRQDH